VSYVFEDKGDHYQVQHPITSARFYSDRTEIWDERFEKCVAAGEGWSVERFDGRRWREVPLPKQRISCEIIDEDEVMFVRAAESPEGTLKVSYIVRKI